jgi:hypothetical protein
MLDILMISDTILGIIIGLILGFGSGIGLTFLIHLLRVQEFLLMKMLLKLK